MCSHSVCAQLLNHVRLLAIQRTVAHQAPLQEYWSGLSFPPPGDLPNPEIELTSPAWGGRFTTVPPGKSKYSWGNRRVISQFKVAELQHQGETRWYFQRMKRRAGCQQSGCEQGGLGGTGPAGLENLEGSFKKLWYDCCTVWYKLGFHGGSYSKESACKPGDLGSTPELGRSPGDGNGNPLQYSCLENPMDRGACWVNGFTKSWNTTEGLTHTHAHTHMI